MASTESVSRDDLVVCTCGNQEYKARDAIQAALFRGELDAKWKEFLRRDAAERRADELDLALDEDAIDSAAEKFRYAHDLITAEETEQWLAARGLTLDDFSDYFARQYYGNTLTEEIEPEQVDYPSAPAELRELFTTELILSGQLEHMTTQLSWRLAAHNDTKDSNRDAISAEERRFFDRTGIEPSQLAGWLERVGRDAEWFNQMLALEGAYRQRCETLLVPRAIQREVAALRLPLTGFAAEVIELDSRDSAQEALFCVREDGMSMEEVATEGRYPYRTLDFVLEDVPPELQQRLLSVNAGDILEPIARGDGFELCRIIKKIEPQPDDPKMRSRIEQRLLDRHFSELADKYVERRLSPNPSAE